MVLNQHTGKVRGDSSGKCARDPGADAYNLDVRNLPEVGQYGFEPWKRQQERVASGKDHVPHLTVGTDIIQSSMKILVS